MLLDVGINNYNNRAISRDHSLLKENLAAIVPLKWILFIVYAGVALVSGKIIGLLARTVFHALDSGPEPVPGFFHPVFQNQYQRIAVFSHR